MGDHEETGRRFDAAVAAYAESPVHARGEDLALLRDLAPEGPHDLLVDVSCGPGHAARALAREARRVVGVDLARGMLEEARRGGDDGKAPPPEGVQAHAGALPLASGVADVVVNRVAAHHYGDLDGAVAELARVLDGDGVLLVVDNVEPADPGVAAFLHELERRRDPTHVRSRSPSRWAAAFAAARLEAEAVDRFRTRLDVEAWARRAGGEDAGALRRRLAGAPAAVRDALEVRDGGASFTLPKVVWRAEPAAPPDSPSGPSPGG